MSSSSPSLCAASPCPGCARCGPVSSQTRRRKAKKDTANDDKTQNNNDATSPPAAAAVAPASSSSSYELIHYEHLPAWLKDNEHITSGYRWNIGWKNSCHSMCHLHNETINFWTHILAFLLMLVLLLATMSSLSPFGVDRINVDIVKAHAPTAGDGQIHDPALLEHHSFISSVLDPSNSPAEIIHDVFHRLNSHIPSLHQLTQSLRAHADKLAPYSAETRAKFLAYLTEVEERVVHLKASLAASSIGDVKEALAEHLAHVTKHLTVRDPRQIDLVQLTTHMLDDFVKKFQEEMKNNSEIDYQLMEQQHGLFPAAIRVNVKRMGGLGTGSPVMPFQSAPRESHSDDYGESNLYDDETLQLHTYLPRWPLTVFMVSAMSCLLFSALFHLFQAVNPDIAIALQNLDYAGICFLISGSNIPILYYGFYCSPITKWTYMIIMMVLGTIGFFVAMNPAFRAVKYRTFKTIVFLTIGFSGVIPLCHLLHHLQHIHFIFWYLLAMGFFYLSGAFVYFLQVPERWRPGAFNIYFASHQLWHVSIVFAVLVHFLGMLHLFEWRMMKVCEI